MVRVTVSLSSVACLALNTFAAADHRDLAKLICTHQPESAVFGSRDGFDDSIVKETPLRVQVCNRSGDATKVQEITF
jgi:hypothetical protein